MTKIINVDFKKKRVEFTFSDNQDLLDEKMEALNIGLTACVKMTDALCTTSQDASLIRRILCQAYQLTQESIQKSFK